MWYDLDINFSKKPSGDLTNQTGIKAIENSIGNIFRTRISSRRMLYPFASPAYAVLFEQIDEETARKLGHELLDAIAYWETRVVAENIHVTAKPDENYYLVTLTYRVINEGNVRYTYEDILRVI